MRTCSSCHSRKAGFQTAEKLENLYLAICIQGVRLQVAEKLRFWVEHRFSAALKSLYSPALAVEVPGSNSSAISWAYRKCRVSIAKSR
jgi:hypothetical protein